MEFNMIMALIVVFFTVASMVLIPWLKKKGWWMATLFAVNIAEQIFNYAKAGPDRFAWVDKLLQQLIPKLTALEREMLIEELVDRMNGLKEG
jgi:hypothetical protein